jgi:apolipoprotein N-acyltransferase
MFSIVFLNALLQSIVFVFYDYLISKFPIKKYSFLLLSLFIPVWLSFEYFHFNWFLSWPWLNIGNFFCIRPDLVQWYCITGILGGSLWVLIVNILLYHSISIVFDKKIKTIISFLLILLSILFLLLPNLYNIYDLNNLNSGAKSLKYCLVQPNIDTYKDKFDKNKKDSIQSENIDMIDSLCQIYRPDILVSPETIFVEYINEDYKCLKDLKIKLDKISKTYSSTVFIIGIHSYSLSTNNKDTLWYNSALKLENGDFKFHHKAKLVPMFEFNPFQNIMRSIGLDDLNIAGYSGTYSKDNDSEYFQTNDEYIVNPIICYESVFGEFSRPQKYLPSVLNCIITNDGWWEGTDGFTRHYRLSKLRAIEYNTEIIRVANNGVTAHLDNRGFPISRLKPNERNALVGRIKLANKPSIYSIYGNYIGKFSVLCLSVFVFMLLVLKKIKSN